jgi:hypothetical protein
MAHFPALRMEMWSDTMKYAPEILILKRESSSWFQDFQEHKAASSLFSAPSDVNVETVPD